MLVSHVRCLINENPTRRPLPRLAIVVIGRNEGDRLRLCLDSILAMSYPKAFLEVIYVDSSSSDASVLLAEAMGIRTILLTGTTTAAMGRNAGWHATDAPFVLFLDGDTLLDPGFVRVALSAMEDPSIAGAFGTRRELDTGSSVYNAVFDLDWDTASGPALYFGGDALVRTDALRAVSGYNPDLIAGEEPDLCRRMRGLGYTILRLDAPMTLHDLDMHSLRQYWRRSVRTGYAYAEVSSFYASTSDPLWRIDSRRNVVRGVCWTLVPLAALATGVLFRSVLPILLFALPAAALVARTVGRVRPRAQDLRRAIAYGVHSHLQHIPILLGQLRFWLLGRGRYKGRLIEYKMPH